MSEKKPTVINQLYKYFGSKLEGDEWVQDKKIIYDATGLGLANTVIADKLGQILNELRFPSGEWVEVRPDTLPEPHRYCVLVMATERKIFATGAVNGLGEWYLANFPTERPHPLFYMLLPDVTAEMQDAREAIWEAKDEEL